MVKIDWAKEKYNEWKNSNQKKWNWRNDGNTKLNKECAENMKEIKKKRNWNEISKRNEENCREMKR